MGTVKWMSHITAYWGEAEQSKRSQYTTFSGNLAVVFHALPIIALAWAGVASAWTVAQTSG